MPHPHCHQIIILNHSACLPYLGSTYISHVICIFAALFPHWTQHTPISPILSIVMSTPATSCTPHICQNSNTLTIMDSLNAEHVMAHAAQQLTTYTGGLCNNVDVWYWWKVVDVVWHELVSHSFLCTDNNQLQHTW